jgi:hypothetical protein
MELKGKAARASLVPQLNSLAREIACKQMVTENRLPNQFTCGSDTRHGLQRFLEWLSQTGEEVLLAKRAIARARIVRAIAKEK